MRVWKETMDSPELKSAWREPRFFWPLTRMWHEAKAAKRLPEFWPTVRGHLEEFDQVHPAGHRPAALAPAERPEPLAMAPPMMLAAN